MSDLACDAQYYFLIRFPGPRPPFGAVVRHVYGENANVDTDGDSATPRAADWTWLYMQLRPQRNNAVVEICMIDRGAAALRITSEDKDLARVTAEFLARETGGELIAR